MEEFFLSLFFAGDKLQIIDDEYVDIAVFIGEAFLFKTNTFKELLDECLRAYI
ncbi:hypothetical protein D3C86_1803230 [compost metagenome]